MFVSCVCHQFQPHLIQWRAMESTHFSEHRRSSHRWGHHFQLLRTCQNMSKPTKKTSELTIHMRNNSKILNVSFWRLEMRLCLIPSWTGGSSRFMPCTSSSSARWASCEASLQHCTSVQKRKGSRSPAQFLPSHNTATYWFIVYCMKVLYIYTNHNCM